MLYNVLIKSLYFIEYHAMSLDWDQLTLFQSQTGTKTVNAVNMVAYKSHSLMFPIFKLSLPPCFEVISKGIWLLAHYIKQLLPLAEALHHAKVK